ncbi:RDD family protein [Chitinimonas naiadis]
MSENHNPYAASEGVALDVSDSAGELASRGARLGAAIIDGIILSVLIWPVLFFIFNLTPTIMATLGFGAKLLISLGGAALYIAVNGYFLQQGGQTVGKKLVGIRVVRSDGSKADLVHLIVRRFLPPHLANLIPIVGSFAALIDVLFIFRQNRLCLHDQIADTKVVNA